MALRCDERWRVACRAGAAAFVVIASASLLGCGTAASESLEGSPTTRAELDAACRRCHALQAEQWSASLHRASFSDADFQAGYARERRATCRGCHAPEADPRGEPTPWAAAHGIACVTCHVPADASSDGAVLAAPRAGSVAVAPHAVRREPSWASAGACAGCHEFDFPRRVDRPDPPPMQLTLTEHARSEHADTSCAECHMPADAGGRSDHRFFVSRNAELLRDALYADVRREPEAVVFTLAPVGVGHAFPTGDLFRRLELRVEAAGGREVASRYLARHFTPPLGASPTRRARVAVPDDRLVGSAEHRLDVAPDLGPLRWSVRYQRPLLRRPHAPREAVLQGEIVLAEGALP